jgi:hypothetical protein
MNINIPVSIAGSSMELGGVVSPHSAHFYFGFFKKGAFFLLAFKLLR